MKAEPCYIPAIWITILREEGKDLDQALNEARSLARKELGLTNEDVLNLERGESISDREVRFLIRVPNPGTLTRAQILEQEN